MDTRKERVIDLLLINYDGLSCTEITKLLAEQELADVPDNLLQAARKNKLTYMSGGVSSLLHRMVHVDKLLIYSKRKTKRNGHIYKIKVKA